MRKNISKIILAVIATIVVLITFCVTNCAADIPVEMYPMKATAYCSGTTTASGKQVREGMCASKPEWIGLMVAVYERTPSGRIGDFIGYYDVEDTGGKSIRNGKVLDIYMNSYDDAIQFGSKQVYVQIIRGQG